jgi:hypothetical protein
MNQADQSAKRGIIVSATIIYFFMIEPQIIMLGSSFNDVVVGGVSLDDNLSGFKPTPSSASYLT